MELKDILENAGIKGNFKVDVKLSKIYDIKFGTPLEAFIETDKNITYKYYDVCDMCGKNTYKLKNYLKVTLCDKCLKIVSQEEVLKWGNNKII